MTNALVADRETMVARHAPVVRELAHELSPKGAELDDAIQDGYVGLLVALQRHGAEVATTTVRAFIRSHILAGCRG